jgi:hypothetical protein
MHHANTYHKSNALGTSMTRLYLNCLSLLSIAMPFDLCCQACKGGMTKYDANVDAIVSCDAVPVLHDHIGSAHGCLVEVNVNTARTAVKHSIILSRS